MARDAVEFEWKKFRKTLKDSETEISDLSLISEFQDTESWVEENCELLMAFSPELFWKSLRRLNDELGECRIVWQHYYNQVTDKKKKKNMVNFNPLSKIWWVLRTRRKSLAQIREEMLLQKEFCERARMDDRTQHRRPTFQLSHSDNVIGFDEFADEIEDVLLGIRREDNKKKDDDGFIACGITGMGGVGKTELARKVFNSPRIRQEFPTQIWVCLADYRRIDTDMDVQIGMLKYMLHRLDHRYVVRDGGIVELLDELRDVLSRRKYLIVLDGAWQDHPWFLNLHNTRHSDEDQSDRLSYGLPSGGAVIVTSRREHLVKRMVGEHSFTTHLDHETSSLQEICCRIFEDNLGTEIFKKDEITTKKMGSDNCNEIEEMLLRGETGKFTRLSPGKHDSALIEQAFNSARIAEEFPTRIWIRWSDMTINPFIRLDAEMNALILRKLRELKSTYDEDDDRQLLKKLRRELSIRKFFIVWDGVPNSIPYDSWYQKLLFSNSRSGNGIDLEGAVIVMTKWDDREPKYCPTSFEYDNHKMGTVVLQMCLPKIKDDIKYKFQGLPLAAQSLARVIPRQLDYLVKERTEKEKSGAWPGLEFCVIYTSYPLMPSVLS